MVLVPKKSVTLQAERVSSPDVAPISGRIGADLAASSASQAPPVVVPMPLAGQVDTGAEGAPSEVAEQLAMEVIPLLTSERAKLSLTLVAPSVVGVAPPVKAPLTQTEVAMIVTSQAQPDATTVVPEDAARSVPPVA